MFKELNILKLFFEKPTREFNVREVGRLVKISPATASKELKRFVKEGLLRERKERMLLLYKANMESDYYRDFKIFYNIMKIKNSKLIDALNKFYLKPTIILFGSTSNGFDTEMSDLDLLLISERTEIFPDLLKFEKKINRKIQIIIVKDVKHLKNEYLINNILNGTVLQGKIKWI
ncbi:unnamed protein product [marine sediment metagenome]|uniref:Polymerase nucleotidyl transferase domain-containing protein n=1 Tax=marine sediment metagenome TaxID=412755 RepID=X0X3B5_9ZZZZ